MFFILRQCELLTLTNRQASILLKHILFMFIIIIIIIIIIINNILGFWSFHDIDNQGIFMKKWGEKRACSINMINEAYLFIYLFVVLFTQGSIVSYIAAFHNGPVRILHVVIHNYMKSIHIVL